MNKEIQEAYKEGYRKGYLDGLDGFNKLQNARSTTEWVNIPEASDKTTEKEIEDLKKEIEVLKEVDEFLHRRIKKLEKELYG